MSETKPELWPVVTDEDRVIRYATEQECHGTPKLRHRTVFVAAFRNDELMLQRRSTKKALYPGMWTLSASGHVKGSEPYIMAALREFEEELGTQPKGNFIEVVRTRIDLPEHPSWSALFRTGIDFPIRTQPYEVDGIGFYNLEQVKEMYDQLTPPSRIMLNATGWL